MIRNLANMTRVGVLESKEHLALVTGALGDAEIIRKSRVHPMTVLIALRTYALGHGLRGQNTWNPIIRVTDALDEAFYTAFGNVETTGKAHLLGVDVSGSMSSGMVAGAPITPREAAVAMALVTLHAEEDVEIMGFSGRFIPLNFSRRTRLDDAVNATARLPFERTDCSLPMIWARQHDKNFDAFVVLTDSETWAGLMHPSQALQQYRERQHADAKLAVIGMVSNGFSIADPNDRGMIDFVGFDTATPQILSDFVAGRI
jgi:60 kDa SS-A/Ro ribonucleoprotein